MKVYAKYMDHKDKEHGGAVSPAYWTTTNPDGTYTIKIPDFVDPIGRTHKWEANTGRAG